VKNGQRRQNLNNGEKMNLLISIRDAEITGVEKGNAAKDVERPVCAFSFLDDDGNKVKALLKGTIAKVAYENYLANNNTEGGSIEFEDGTTLEKLVTVSFDAYIREERETEVVLDEITDLIFNFKYRIVG
jgi:hypothetical protein